MSQAPVSNPNGREHRNLRGLLIWIALIPLILGTMMCFGQLALVLTPFSLGGDTGSLLSADYKPWPYDLIPAVNIEAFFGDLNKEMKGTPLPNGTVTVIVGQFWLPPTPTASSNLLTTPTPPVKATSTPVDHPSNTPTSALPTAAFRSSATPQSTGTPIPTVRVETMIPPVQPTDTLSPSPRPPLPATNTPLPPPNPATHTPTLKPPATATPKRTPSLAPTRTPTYAPVRPLAENNGIADPNPATGECKAYFGYRNDNPVEVTIPVGSRNAINDPSARISPSLPSHFLVGRVFGSFQVTWKSGQPLVWSLDGRDATVNWCITPP